MCVCVYARARVGAGGCGGVGVWDVLDVFGVVLLSRQCVFHWAVLARELLWRQASMEVPETARLQRRWPASPFTIVCRWAASLCQD